MIINNNNKYGCIQLAFVIFVLYIFLFAMPSHIIASMQLENQLHFGNKDTVQKKILQEPEQKLEPTIVKVKIDEQPEAINLFFLVDHSKSMKKNMNDKCKRIIEHISQFLYYHNLLIKDLKHQVGMALFAKEKFDDVYQLQTINSNTTKILLNMIDYRTKPFTDFLPALQCATSQFHNRSLSSSKKKILIIITDGSYEIEAPRRNEADYVKEITKMLSKLRNANITIYFFGINVDSRFAKKWEEWIGTPFYFNEPSIQDITAIISEHIYSPPAISDTRESKKYTEPKKNIYNKRDSYSYRYYNKLIAIICLFIACLFIFFLLSILFTLKKQSQKNSVEKNELDLGYSEAKKEFRNGRYKLSIKISEETINKIEQSQLNNQEYATKVFEIMIDSIIKRKKDLFKKTKKYLFNQDSIIIKSYSSALKLKLAGAPDKCFMLFALLKHNSGVKIFKVLSKKEDIPECIITENTANIERIEGIIKIIYALTSFKNYTELKHILNEMKGLIDKGNNECLFIEDTINFLIDNPLYPYNFKEKKKEYNIETLLIFNIFYEFLKSIFTLPEQTNDNEEPIKKIKEKMKTITNGKSDKMKYLNVIEINVSKAIAIIWINKIEEIEKNKSKLKSEGRINIESCPKVEYNYMVSNEKEYTITIENNMKMPVWNIVIKASIYDYTQYQPKIEPEKESIFMLKPGGLEYKFFKCVNSGDKYDVSIKLDYNHWFCKTTDDGKLEKKYTISRIYESNSKVKSNPYLVEKKDLSKKSETTENLLKKFKQILKLNRKKAIWIYGLKGIGKSSIIDYIIINGKRHDIFAVKISKQYYNNNIPNNQVHDAAIIILDSLTEKLNIDPQMYIKYRHLLPFNNNSNEIKNFIEAVKKDNQKFIFFVDDAYKVKGIIQSIIILAENLNFQLVLIDNMFHYLKQFDPFFTLASYKKDLINELINCSKPVLNYSKQAKTYLNNITGGHPEFLLLLFHQLYDNCFKNEISFNVDLPIILKTTNDILNNTETFSKIKAIFDSIPSEEREFLEELVFQKKICSYSLKINFITEVEKNQKYKKLLENMSKMQILIKSSYGWKLNIGLFKMLIEKQNENQITRNPKSENNNALIIMDNNRDNVKQQKTIDVLFSYNNLDENEVAIFKDQLEVNNLKVFMASKDMKIGVYWPDEFFNKMKTSNICAIIIAKNGISNKSMLDEIRNFQIHKDEYNFKIFPIIISDISDRISKETEKILRKNFLSSINRCNIYNDKKRLNKLIQEIKDERCKI